MTKMYVLGSPQLGNLTSNFSDLKTGRDTLLFEKENVYLLIDKTHPEAWRL